MPVRADSPDLDASLIEDVDVSDELSTSFLAYSMSVIVSRALPDVRDGLKPVHRRILWSMHEQGMRPDRGYSKCARAVGDTMGKYHPHGDSAIYEAMVRMAQPWSLRLPLVDGHGNFGSLDDGPAASRYTEARLAASSMAMVSELDEDTVDFRPNYDGREREPSVLPSALPNLLVNGSTGIAVGMATSIPPHNLVEVVAGLRAMLADPGLDLPALMEHIPGPDFPCGGIIHGLDGMREAYRTGRGQFKVRARASVEEVSARRRGIVVTELPPGVGPERVIARVRELVQARKLQGISDISDLSDRSTGLRLVVECKAGFSAEAVLGELYRLTPLEETFGANNVALVASQPQTLGLLQMCSLFLDHRLEVVRRRSEFRLRKAEDRVHVLEGLLVALGAIDEVIALVRGSKDSATARARLMKRFELSERQAEAILEMTIRRLTSLEVGKLTAEVKELRAQVAALRALLGSPARMRELVSVELEEAARQFGTPRRSTLMEGVPVVTAPLEVPDDPCAVVLAPDGGLLRVASLAAVKGPRLGSAAATMRGHVLVLTSSGMMLRIPVLEVPEAAGRGKGRSMEVPGLPAGDAAVAVLPLAGIAHLATSLGMVKRLDLSALAVRDAQRAMALRDGDRVLGGVALAVDQDQDACFVLVCSAGRLLRFPASSVRPQGASAAGVGGMRLDEGERVVGFGLSAAGSLVACASDAGLVKWTPVEEYPVKGRAGSGMRCMTLRRDEQEVACAVVAPAFAGLSQTGAVVKMSLPQARRDAPGADAGSPVRTLLPA